MFWKEEQPYLTVWSYGQSFSYVSVQAHYIRLGNAKHVFLFNSLLGKIQHNDKADEKTGGPF
jgi:phage anti-repressor protein